MKTFITIFLLIGFVSCSSVPKTGDQSTDKVIAHIAEGPKVIGKDFDEKFTKDGFVNGEYIAIGTATATSVNYNTKSLRLSAETDAMTRLLRSAPTDFKRIVQKVLNSVANNDGASSETAVSITEVRALTGLRSNYDDIQCVQTAIPLENGRWGFEKECRMILRIDAVKLNEAYDYTLSSKYSIKRKNEIEDMVNKELINKTNSLDKVSINP